MLSGKPEFDRIVNCPVRAIKFRKSTSAVPIHKLLPSIARDNDIVIRKARIVSYHTLSSLSHQTSPIHSAVPIHLLITIYRKSYDPVIRQARI